MKSLGRLFFTCFALIVVSCSPQPTATDLKECIIGTWQDEGGAHSSPGGKRASTLSRMEFKQDGRIIWDMGTPDKTLRFRGNYTVMDDDTIRVDFIQYSNKSAVWEIVCSRMPDQSALLTVRDRDAATLVASMQRMY